jgi:EmrB/QacA subfamily drug resistance transporter
MVTTAEPLDHRRWYILAVLCLSLTVIGIDNTILNVALPSIVEGLHASGSQLQWMVDAYTIVFACLLLTAGALGDRFGRRRALLLGLAWFGTFSALASLATTGFQLILARGAMGIGGAFIFPTTLSILTNVFTEPRERSRAIGIWAGVSGVGIAVGPLLGGFLVEHFGWHAVFWVNAPVCALGFVLSAIVIPRTTNEVRHPLDPFGAVLSVVGLVGLLYAIIEAPNGGWTAPGVAAGFVIAAIGLGLFAWWEATCEHPMLDVQFFRNPRFSAASATITITTFGLYASTFLLTQYFQFTLGYSPLKAGVMITPVAVGLMIGSPQAPKLVDRYGTKRVVLFGLAIVAVGMACYGSNTLMSNFAIGMVIRLFYGLAFGFVGPPVTESIMGSIPKERAGVGSAVNDTTRQVGGALGVAVLGSIFAARYHQVMDGASALPAAVRSSARESIGTTLEVVRGTKDAGLATRLRDAGFDAFHSSMRLTYAIAVAIILGAMYVAWRYLPAEAVEIDHPVATEVDPVTGGLSVADPR